jgi:hypothetical protein
MSDCQQTSYIANVDKAAVGSVCKSIRTQNGKLGVKCEWPDGTINIYTLETTYEEKAEK